MGKITVFLPVFLCALTGNGGGEDSFISPAPLPTEDDETLSQPAPEVPGRTLSGDWRLRVRRTTPPPAALARAPASLRHTPFIYQRARLRAQNGFETGAMMRRPSPGPVLDPRALREAGTVKGFIRFGDRFIAGDYALSFGQGLIFYDQLGEFVRPVLVKKSEFSPDLSGASGAYFRGAAAALKAGGWESLGFISRQFLNAPLTPEGAADVDLWSLRASLGDPDSAPDLAAWRRLREDMGGARMSWRGEGFHVGATAAVFRMSPAVLPAEGGPFRGRRNEVWGLDAGGTAGPLSWGVEGARSRGVEGRGGSWTGTLLRKEGRVESWAGVFFYDGRFFSRTAKGPAFDVQDLPGSLPRNQRGLSFGSRVEGVRHTLEGDASWARFPAPQGDGRNRDPLTASAGRRWRLAATFLPTRAWELTGRLQERIRDRWEASTGGERRLGPETVRRFRLESAWRASPRWRWRARHDWRWERAPLAGRRNEGRSFMNEVRWTPDEAWAASARLYAFDSPEAFLTAGFEEIWDGVVSDRLAGGMGNLRGAPGERWALTLRRRWGRVFRAWIKYDTNRRWRGADASDVRHAWHAQADFSF